MSASLKDGFHEEMLDTYRIASRHDYTPSVFKENVERYGGVESAKYWLRASGPQSPQSGLTRLCKLGLLGVSMEALVLRKRWKRLFTDAERQEARRRLNGHGYGECARKECGSDLDGLPW